MERFLTFIASCFLLAYFAVFETSNTIEVFFVLMASAAISILMFYHLSKWEK